MRRIVIPGILLLLAGGVASADQLFIGVSSGYSRLHENAKPGFYYAANGAYVDTDVALKVQDSPFPVLLGGGVSWADHEDTIEPTYARPDGSFAATSLHSGINLVTGEIRAAAPMYITKDQRLFVIPRIGAGFLLDSYRVNTLHTVGGVSRFPTFAHDGSAFEVRPCVEIGYAFDHFSVGAEMSYMLAWGDLGGFGSEAREFRAGAFIRFKF